MKYKIPVTLLVETENDGIDESESLSVVQLDRLKKSISSNLNYVVSDMDFLYDSIQENLPEGFCLISLKVEVENEKDSTKIQEV